MFRSLTALTTLVSLAAGAGAQTTIHVDPAGSFDPTGSAWAPYPTLAAGLAHAAATGAGLALAPDEYHGTMVLDRPMTLTGPMTLGTAEGESTTLTVASLNTHLYGDALDEGFFDILAALNWIDPLHWLDDHRATRIGQGFTYTHHVDVAALQEVWDSGVLGYVVNHAPFAEHAYGSYVDFDELTCIMTPITCITPWLNSGLATLANDIVDGSVQQVVYNAETGDDDFFEPFSSKSFLLTEIVKDGFTIAVFNTHMQAGPASNAHVENARWWQIDQLANAVRTYRVNNPGTPVIVLGDFNVVSSGGGEYKGSLEPLLGQPGVDLIDAARADYVNRARNGITSDAANRLGQYFHPDSTHSTRLDYVCYAHAANDSVRLVLEWVDTVRHRGPSSMSDDGISTIELSDHWGVHARFRVVRR